MSKEREIWLIRMEGSNVLYPLNEPDQQAISRIAPMKETCFSYKHIRSPQFHRRYFALINLAFENQHHYTDIYVFRKILEMRAGYFEPVITETKKKLYLPKSISYDTLDQTDFELLYSKVWGEIEKLLNLVKEEDKEMFLNELASLA